MSLGLQYKNQEHIFDEKRESCIMDFLQNSEVSARDAGQL